MPQSKPEGLYPPIEPYSVETLSVSDLHTLSFEQVGNPDGRPALFLHGGPGVGIHPDYRRFFDPARYRIVLPDQRGAGKSTPHAEIRDNTTWDIVDDLELLRQHLGIRDWVVMGGSWGSLLALCYAIRHPQAVAGLIIRGVFLGRPWELDWIYGPNGAARMYPDEWHRVEQLIDGRPDVLGAYNELLDSDDPQVAREAAAVWSRWEGSMNSLFPSDEAMSLLVNEHSSLSIARLEAHYAENAFFLPGDNYVLDNAGAIAHIPCRIVQGRYDTICPPQSAWELSRALPKARLKIVSRGAHSPLDPDMATSLRAAADEFGDDEFGDQAN